MMKEELLEEKLGGIENLPTLPLVLQHLQKLVNSPNSNMNQIANVVMKDQALAMKTIRLVNSAFYARPQKVTSIRQAIVLIGLDILKNLMLGLSVIKMFNTTDSFGFSPARFWEHCFGVALLARKMAIKTRVGDPEEYFIAGLLHDIGRLVLEQFLHDEYSSALKKAHDTKTSLLIKEIEMFGFSHAEAGGWLGKRWGIPESIIVIMDFHHKPEILPPGQSGYKKMLLTIVCADILSKVKGIGYSGDPCVNEKSVPEIDGIDEKTLQIMVEETQKEITQTVHEWNKV